LADDNDEYDDEEEDDNVEEEVEARDIRNSCVFFCHSSTLSSGAEAYPNPGKSIKYNLDCLYDTDDDALVVVVA
jgi:hypothetical protein